VKKLPIIVAIVGFAMFAVSRVIRDPKPIKHLLASLKAKMPQELPIAG
jgi:hypothetical protein